MTVLMNPLLLTPFLMLPARAFPVLSVVLVMMKLLVRRVRRFMCLLLFVARLNVFPRVSQRVVVRRLPVLIFLLMVIFLFLLGQRSVLTVNSRLKILLKVLLLKLKFRGSNRFSSLVVKAFRLPRMKLMFLIVFRNLD